jgi:hypothetical protein
MQSNFNQPLNIGSEEMISINDLAKKIIALSGKNLSINNIDGPIGVRGRNSDNRLARQVLSLDEVPNCKLSTLAQFFGTGVDPNHRALDDAKATTEVLHGLLERLGSMNINTEEKLFDFVKNAKRIQNKKFYGQPSI